jgi:4-amino-4-deoxy-L-arabinose transferase-like glycosyltransferase
VIDRPEIPATGAAWWSRSGLWIAAYALVLAFSFLGSRGIWDPDEGRYTNVAINMLESGDWMNPRRNEEVGHWTKPPLTYWAIASSVAVFGMNPWAARLPVALSYLLCVWLAWRIARRVAPGTEADAAVIYATMLLPFGSAQMVTTDFLLTAFETLAIWAFVESRHGAKRPALWIALMWSGFALAFLTKGPPGLLPLLVVLLFDWLMPGRHRALRISGLAVFVALALPWYLAVILDNPGLFEYFIGDEVVNRITTDEFGRHGEWYGWAEIYVPTLLIGTLPWTATLWRWVRGLPASLRRWRDAQARRDDAWLVFLTAWVLLPLLVFCLARSRMPLYVLPLFVPLAILAAIQRDREGRALPRWTFLLAWTAVLLGLKLAAAWWPSHKDASKWAEAIEARTQAPVHEVVFVSDMARYGLRLHLDAEIEKVDLDPIPPGSQSRFNPVYDEDLATELEESREEPGAIWICKEALWPEVRAHIRDRGFRAIPIGTPYQQRIIFRTDTP